MLPVSGGTQTMPVLALIYRVARLDLRLGGPFCPEQLPLRFYVGASIYCLEFTFQKMQYGFVYGGLAAAIGLMVWMEFSAMIVFLGVGLERRKHLSTYFCE